MGRWSDVQVGYDCVLRSDVRGGFDYAAAAWRTAARLPLAADGSMVVRAGSDVLGDACWETLACVYFDGRLVALVETAAPGGDRLWALAARLRGDDQLVAQLVAAADALGSLALAGFGR